MRLIGWLRQRNRGVGSIIVAVFIALIILSAFAFYAVTLNTTQQYNNTISSMSATDWNRNQENIEIKQIAITGTNQLNVTAENYGSIQSHIIWLGIFNTTATPQNQTYQALNVFIEPGKMAYIVSSSTITAGNIYLVQLTTELGNTVESSFYPANNAQCALTLMTTPPTVYQGNNITVLFTVTPNDTTVDFVQNLTAILNATPANLVQLVSNSPLSVTGLAQGTSAFFWWVYNAGYTGTVTFNATYLPASTGTYVLSTAQIIAASQPSAQGNISITGVNCTALQNPSGWNPVGSTQNVSGSISSLASNDTNYFSFSSYSSGANINQFVNTTSAKVDNITNIGTQSNFTAQQAGPDKVNDTLTEADIPIISGNTQYVQTNSTLYDIDIGTSSNFSAEQATDNIYDTLTEANTPYIPITFTNNQTTATPSPFQEKITWNPSSYTSYEASDLGNIRFYSDNALTTPLYAWLESCTPSLSNTATSATAWIKLTSPIAANGGTLTVYMVFLSTSTDFDGNYWGDAPNLSSPYGQNDNGAKVFNFYDNFAGTSLNPQWTVFGSSQGTVSVSNGVTITSSSSTLSVGIFASYTPPTTGIVTETYLNAATPTAGYRVFDGYGMTSTSTAEQNGYIGILQAVGQNTLKLSKMVSGTQTDLVSSTDALTAGGNYESSLLWQSSTLTMADLTNGHSASTTDTTYSLSTMTQVALAVGATSGNKYITYWFRVRQSPPSNVMPSISFGSVTLPNYRLDLERQWTTASYTANASKLLCIKTGAFSGSEALEVDVWNGAWTVLNNSLAANSWNNMSVTTYLTSASFAIRFMDAARGALTQSTWQIDSVLLYTSNSTDNYQLNIEEHWTNVTYTANQWLCIFAGNWTTAAALEVDGWNTTSSNWVVLNSSLVTNAWNNITLPTGLLTSNFTIRFKNGNPAGDTVQNSWSIDATLLHLWNNQYTAQVEFTDYADLQNWTQLVWLADSSWNTSSVNVTVQLYNYTFGGYPSSGNGYVSYSSSSTINTDQCINQTITSRATDFRNSTGYWKVEITGVASTQFQMNINWIELRDSYAYVNDSIPYKAWIWYTIQATGANGNPLPYTYVSLYANGTTVAFQNATSPISDPAWMQLDANGTFQLQIESTTSLGETFVLYVAVGIVEQQKTITQVPQL